MTPTRPYLLRAVYDWIVDNDCTPFLAVNAEWPEVTVPMDYVEDGQITLNVSPTAVASLHMDDDAVSFNARFSGTPRNIYVPMGAVIGIYARENGQGMAFPDEYEMPEGSGDDPDPPTPAGGGGKPRLKVVK